MQNLGSGVYKEDCADSNENRAFYVQNSRRI